MPLGCEYHYVIFRKDSLWRIREVLSKSADDEALEYVDFLLTHKHSDDYLVALQDEGAGFSDRELSFWEDKLGLKWHDGYESVDLYIPSIEVPICRWLEYSLVPAIDNGEALCYLIGWDTYRFIGDTSREVIVAFSGSVQPFIPDLFPIAGNVIDTSRYDDLNLEMLEHKPSWYGNPPNRIR